MLGLGFCVHHLVPVGVKDDTSGAYRSHSWEDWRPPQCHGLPSWEVLPVSPSPSSGADVCVGLDLLQSVSTALLSTSDESASDP